jgi:glutathione peroxidase
MTVRQILLKAAYPLIMLRNRLVPHDRSIQKNEANKTAPVSFYSLHTKANNGTDIDFAGFKGKKVLLVNTASNCGFTGQYAELEELHQRFQQQLVVIGFPANDFKQQEQLDDAGIAAFCKVNFGVTFLLAKKSQVIEGDAQNPVFNWLTHAEQNGWTNQQPLWNFNKYLVDEQGRLAAFFAHTVSPLHPQMITLIEKTAA